MIVVVDDAISTFVTKARSFCYTKILLPKEHKTHTLTSIKPHTHTPSLPEPFSNGVPSFWANYGMD